MPAVSTSIRVSKDGQYILATGIYKPKVKCFDVNNLSLKFERCFDSEVITFEVLSDDYSKLVFLQCDRHIEFHAAHGKYYRLRIPRFGRDMQYHYPSCDLFVVGVSNEIYRLNLEKGQFLQSFVTEASAINKCAINPVHHALMIGTQEGKIEAWDPRMKNRVGVLDCGFHCAIQNSNLLTVPSITALKFQGSLTMGIGTATGHILLYDIRSNKPFMVKDHMYGLPIRNIEFHEKMDLIYSMDSSIVKIWEKETGKLYTSVESQSDFNDLCIVPKTGMFFIANEDSKIQSYYIPSLGPAPAWCSFLDNLTEELEELDYETIYDDYKFVTEKELEELGLSHLKGTNLLKAYMHGYFMDIRLYRKARDVSRPFAFEEYKKKRIRQKIEEECASRVQVQKLPKVNKELALKMLDTEKNDNPKKKKKTTENLLKDDRFKALFTNPDFQVDTNSEEYSLLKPVVSQLDKTRAKKLKKELAQTPILEDELENYKKEGNSDFEGSSSDSSSEDEKPWVKEVQKQYRLIKKKEKQEERENALRVNEHDPMSAESRLQFYEIKEGVDFRDSKATIKKRDKASLGDRLQEEESQKINITGSRGNKEMTFSLKEHKHNGRSKGNVNRHRKEYKHLLRPAGNIGKKKH
ncbi:nucleolar protein 10 isoform X2 [Orussus abietinus]|nr:nucleolar protein 10 isoform X2 [Orussus abietinus]